MPQEDITTCTKSGGQNLLESKGLGVKRYTLTMVLYVLWYKAFSLVQNTRFEHKAEKLTCIHFDKIIRFLDIFRKGSIRLINTDQTKFWVALWYTRANAKQCGKPFHSNNGPLFGN